MLGNIKYKNIIDCYTVSFRQVYLQTLSYTKEMGDNIIYGRHVGFFSICILHFKVNAYDDNHTLKMFFSKTGEKIHMY